MSTKPTLLWTNQNREHIKKHGLTPKEVEEAYDNSKIIQPSREPRLIIFGTTTDRKIVIIVAKSNQSNKYYVITARDMSKTERKLYAQYKTN